MNAGFDAVARLYHAFLTGIILSTIVKRGPSAAADLVFGIFRAQHHAMFLPGLRKLGIDKLPPAVAAAQYHYLSNQIGGVRVEYMYESDRKAWIRYAPPRWIWEGTAICAIPSEVSQSMLRGWHGHNGVSLGNPRLGFVCTKQTVDGQDGLEGYYYEYDEELAPQDRVRFRRGEEAPPFDPDAAPRLPSRTWPQERLDKAARNYAMEYIRTTLPILIAQLGPAEAHHLGGTAAYQIGMQFFDACRDRLGQREAGAAGFAAFFRSMAEAQGDDVTIAADGEDIVLRQHGWRLMRGLEPQHEAAFDIWNALWEGCLAAHDRHLRWISAERQDQGAEDFVWRLTRRRRPAEGT
jgi:hypothetical protein